MDKLARVIRSAWLVRAILMMVGVMPLLWATISKGQTTSITSSGLNTQVSHASGQPNYDITGGTRPGNGANLFHSLGDFSVGADHIANFRNDSGLATSNILGRVTGGNPSNVFGTIQTSGFGNANLFLMNPAGIVFGPNASLNVGGSVTFTTADYIKLTDGMRFKAMPNAVADTLLSTAPVVAFGFLNAHPRPISVQGASLQVPEGQTLSLIAGDVSINKGDLTAPSGRIDIASVASAGEVTAIRGAVPNLKIGPGTQGGTITLRDGTQVDSSGTNDNPTGGAVFIRGGKLIMNQSQVLAQATRATEQTGVGISIVATKAVDLTDAKLATSMISIGHEGVGGTGPISISAPLMRFAGEVDKTEISTTASNSGHSGNISLHAGRLNAANVDVHAGSGADTNAHPGNIAITATKGIRIEQNSLITSATSGSADAGDISIFSPTLTLTGNVAITTASTSTNFANSGNAGNITINVGRLNMRRNSAPFPTRIDASALNHGPGAPFHSGGAVRVTAKDAVAINGGEIRSDGGSLYTSTPSLQLSGHGRLSADEVDGGSRGIIDLDVGRLTVTSGARISVGSSYGPPGVISINAAKSIITDNGTISVFGGPVTGRMNLHAGESIQIRNGSLISANNGEFSGGHIVIQAGRSFVSRDSTVSAQPGFASNGGTIDVDAKQVTLTNSRLTTAVSNVDSNSIGGKITVNAKDVMLKNSQLLSNAETGTGGAISIQADRVQLTEGATISAASASSEMSGFFPKKGGTIDVDAKQVTLRDSQLTTSVDGGPQSLGGQITVDVKDVTLRNSQILSTAPEGQGGTINIRSHALRRDARTVIDASSQFGTDGTVTIKFRH
jgi:filamentous hemagglutinin family protein